MTMAEPTHADGTSPDHDARLRTTRLIAAALILGQVMFAAIIAFLDLELELDLTNPGLDLVFTGGAALGVLSIPVAWFIRRTVWSRARTFEGQRALASIQAGTVVYYALLEGAALLNLICWMLKGSPTPNIPIVALLLGAQIASFPRREHFAPRESY